MCSIPFVLLDHVGQLDYVLALLVLLTRLEGMFLRSEKIISLERE